MANVRTIIIMDQLERGTAGAAAVGRATTLDQRGAPRTTTPPHALAAPFAARAR
jgi:hypothetical protein